MPRSNDIPSWEVVGYSVFEQRDQQDADMGGEPTAVMLEPLPVKRNIYLPLFDQALNMIKPASAQDAKVKFDKFLRSASETEKLLHYKEETVSVRYELGAGRDPESEKFDCSSYLWRYFLDYHNVNIGSTTTAMRRNVPFELRVPLRAARPGDIVIMDSSPESRHAGIVVELFQGGVKVLHMERSGNQQYQEIPYSSSKWTAYDGRPVLPLRHLLKID